MVVPLTARPLLRSSNSSIPWWASGNCNSHLSFADFRAKYLMNNVTRPARRSVLYVDDEIPEGRRLLAPPADVNWVTAGIVPPVRDQKECGEGGSFTLMKKLYT